VSAPVCVFDLDHTLVDSPLDLRAVGREMETLIRARGVSLPARELRWSGAELLAVVRREVPTLETEVMAIPVAHERRAMEAAVLIPHAVDAVAAMRALGYATAIWTNNDRVVADFVLARFGLLAHLDLVVTRDDVVQLKPDPDGLRVVRARWPEASQIVVVGDSWVDGAAAQAGGVPFIAYRADHAELARRGVTATASISSLLDLPAALA
jgi:haloacid dehalogenase superfamily, subfamily IA, variant 3 with third motif having DD or ED/haloacid dehalogenase superfamily, subfamily IA, variant 1 with third motif having Dx(3-4)D or Dx(3-4)E